MYDGKSELAYTYEQPDMAEGGTGYQSVHRKIRADPVRRGYGNPACGKKQHSENRTKSRVRTGDSAADHLYVLRFCFYFSERLRRNADTASGNILSL